MTTNTLIVSGSTLEFEAIYEILQAFMRLIS